MENFLTERQDTGQKMIPNANEISQSESLQNIYREKKRRLQRKQEDFEKEKELLEQDTRVDMLQAEIDQVDRQIQDVRTKNKKRWYKSIFLWVVLGALGIGGCVILPQYFESQFQKELKKYQQQLETSLTQYRIWTEEQKQELEEQVAELQQQISALK